MWLQKPTDELGKAYVSFMRVSLDQLRQRVVDEIYVLTIFEVKTAAAASGNRARSIHCLELPWQRAGWLVNMVGGVLKSEWQTLWLLRALNRFAAWMPLKQLPLCSLRLMTFILGTLNMPSLEENPECKFFVVIGCSRGTARRWRWSLIGCRIDTTTHCIPTSSRVCKTWSR